MRNRTWDIAAIILTPLVWPIGVSLLIPSLSWSTRNKVIAAILPAPAILVYLFSHRLGLGFGGSCSRGFENSYATCVQPSALQIVGPLLLEVGVLVLLVCSAIWLIKTRRRTVLG